MTRPCYAATMSCVFKSLFVALCLAFLFLTGTAPLAHAQKTTAVTDLRIMRNPNGETRLILDVNGAVHYRSFLLNNPMRLVVDLPNMAWNAPRNKGDRNNYIRSYRTGTYKNDTLRIVFDLNKPVAITHHERLSPRNGHQWQYIIDIKPTSASTYAKAVGQVKSSAANATQTTTHITEQEPVTPSTPVIAPSSPTQTASKNQKKPLIILDPGHGGVDPGAVASNGVYEKHITLATAKEVKALLEQTGRYRVHMTRSTDIYIKLPERVRIGRKMGGDLFISLHADSVGRANVQGASVYTLSETASDAETAKLAERENAVDTLVNVDVGKVDADVADILVDLVTRDTRNQSKVLAETVVKTFGTTGLRLLQNPHRSAGFAVLKAPDIPSVLIEMGYLSNREEADKLASAPHRKKLATSIVATIDRYFNETSKMAAY